MTTSPRSRWLTWAKSAAPSAGGKNPSRPMAMSPTAAIVTVSSTGGSRPVSVSVEVVSVDVSAAVGDEVTGGPARRSEGSSRTAQAAASPATKKIPASKARPRSRARRRCFRRRRRASSCSREYAKCR